ncbi:SmORF protein [Babesia bovis T2Bo]|uniref:SmORF n=1 Tax=Babesia bovis TaxID=5865 RepID=A7AR32_BABBO|nr:SmORF protein [Babesia bovis T2Bo]EDO07001.1 SmORF protein [Babesia bovis T2Bo]|eukprot:XP_001610569.1 SmORF [Babesia bovis T2Bo]
MVAFKMLWKLCVVVAFGLSATVTSTEVAQEKPKKKSLDSALSSKEDEPAVATQEATEPQNTDTEENTETVDPPMFSFEWFLLPKPENRGQLRGKLPWNLAIAVPKDYNKSIVPATEKRIRKFFSLGDVEWYLLPNPINRAALRYSLPRHLGLAVPKDCNKPISAILEKHIRDYFSLKDGLMTLEQSMFSVEWLLLPNKESRAALRYVLPWNLAKDVPMNCEKPIGPEMEERIREHFLLKGGLENNETDTEPHEVSDLENTDNEVQMDTQDLPRFSVKWLLLPKPENRTALRYLLPLSLARRVPEDYNEPIAPLVEKDIRKHFTLYTVGWYLLPKPESRSALRHSLPKDLARMVPEDCNEPIDPELEQDIKTFFSFSAQKQRFLRLHSYFHGI